jgi:hypothetical protein
MSAVAPTIPLPRPTLSTPHQIPSSRRVLGLDCGPPRGDSRPRLSERPTDAPNPTLVSTMYSLFLHVNSDLRKRNLHLETRGYYLLAFMNQPQVSAGQIGWIADRPATSDQTSPPITGRPRLSFAQLPEHAWPAANPPCSHGRGHFDFAEATLRQPPRAATARRVLTPVTRDYGIEILYVADQLGNCPGRRIGRSSLACRVLSQGQLPRCGRRPTRPTT